MSTTPPRRELLAFAATLAVLVAGFLGESLLGGKVLSPADVLRATAGFRDDRRPGDYEPANRLLMDPVLQFQPWLEFNREMIRRGRLPLWNDRVGCGAPHLANGQSAVFDPFHAIAYLGSLPGAHAPMAAARLWVAGLGMFLLARGWGLGPWGRWFAGLAFPFCGFLVVWLLFPVTSVAVWMPWLFLATDRALERPGPRPVGVLAIAAGLVLLGGHVQTSAHVLLASLAYASWRLAAAGRLAPVDVRRAAASWGAGIALGVVLASVEVVPLAVYLSRSPVWADRERAREPIGAPGRPRVLDALCTAFPYAFGSQRRGHPNLARGLGVHNLNESAGGFAGLATLVWLAPLALSRRSRRRQPRVAFLAGMAAFGGLGAFGFPPVANLLRALPVLDVTDNRRLTLWLAFALVLLGGVGIDRLAGAGAGAGVRRGLGTARGLVGLPGALGLAGALTLAAMAVGVARAGPLIRERALEHYARASGRTPGSDPLAYRERAGRQARQALAFTPRYLALAAGQLLALVGLGALARRGLLGRRTLRPAVLGLSLLDLLGFGYGLNPAIAADEDRPEVPLVAYLRREVGPEGRALGVGAELPPNAFMRYGLADVRNYDSVELSRSLDWFAPLYEFERGRGAGPGDVAAAPARTSRRAVTWDGVIRARARLAGSAVRAVVGATPPPPGVFRRVDRVGAVWVARLDDAAPRASDGSGHVPTEIVWDHDLITLTLECASDDRVVVRETWDPSWGAEVDGVPTPVAPHRGAFLAVPLAAGRHRVALRYDPPEVRAALAASVSALAAAVFALTGFRPFRSTRIIALGLGRTQAAELESDL